MVELRCALIGHPVAHSLSPAIHAAAREALQVPGSYELVDAPDRAAVERVIERLRRGELIGVNATVPWKLLALELADRVDASAATVGAANVLARADDGAVVAHNTDVVALQSRIGESVPAPGSVCIIGSGGAALAAIAACRGLGAGDIWVTSRAWKPGGEVARGPRAAEVIAAGGTPLAWPGERGAERAASGAPSDAESESPASTALREWDELVASASVLIQATSAGMHGADSGDLVRDIVPWHRVVSLELAYDVIYAPPMTPFLQAAEACGVPFEGGLGMLVAQAARAVELWHGMEPPLPELRRAAEKALASGSEG